LFEINYLLQRLQEFATLALADYGYRNHISWMNQFSCFCSTESGCLNHCCRILWHDSHSWLWGFTNRLKHINLPDICYRRQFC
jgi:hypothetical protein